ncbi:MAG: reverse transcriptase-like protein [Tissierellia bacterium]|nr:reverse transcriptase-like protein [Tissierellia bacterium]
MAKNYYAVKNGRQIGVFNTWKECEEQVKGYPNAAYKKFSSYEEALEFIKGDSDIQGDKDIDDLKENEAIAYVDGSYDNESKIYGYGVVLFSKDGKFTFSERDDDPKLVEMRNVAGEIKGSMVAMEEALKRGKDTLFLYYDYMGIEKWATGEWKANKYGTKMYRAYYDSIKDKLNVRFIKVKAHAGNKYNEEADKLAKEALDI